MLVNVADAVVEGTAALFASAGKTASKSLGISIPSGQSVRLVSLLSIVTEKWSHLSG